MLNLIKKITDYFYASEKTEKQPTDSPFDTLPDEIILEIMKQFDWQNPADIHALVQLARTSKRFYHLFLDKTFAVKRANLYQEYFNLQIYPEIQRLSYHDDHAILIKSINEVRNYIYIIPEPARNNLERSIRSQLEDIITPYASDLENRWKTIAILLPIVITISIILTSIVYAFCFSQTLGSSNILNNALSLLVISACGLVLGGAFKSLHWEWLAMLTELCLEMQPRKLYIRYNCFRLAGKIIDCASTPLAFASCAFALYSIINPYTEESFTKNPLTLALVNTLLIIGMFFLSWSIICTRQYFKNRFNTNSLHNPSDKLTIRENIRQFFWTSPYDNLFPKTWDIEHGNEAEADAESADEENLLLVEGEQTNHQTYGATS